MPRRWAEEAARLLLNGRLITIDGPAHTITSSQPARFVEAIWPFVTHPCAPIVMRGPGARRNPGSVD